MNYYIPLPVPASIYGMIILFLCLSTGIIKLSDVKDAGKFLIEIMPLMFIPAGVGLIDSWGVLKPLLLPVTVIAGAWRSVLSGTEKRKRRVPKMNDFLQNSAFMGVAISLVAYAAGAFLRRKFKSDVFNPLLIAIAVTILFLAASKTDYETYNNGAKVLSWLLTPATVALAIPLYEQTALLKKNYKAVFAGIISGVLTSLLSILAMAALFRHTGNMLLCCRNPSPQLSAWG